jgi:hypothetical protein
MPMYGIVTQIAELCKLECDLSVFCLEGHYTESLREPVGVQDLLEHSNCGSLGPTGTGQLWELGTCANLAMT